MCDAAFSVVPILNALKANGYKVGVCGNRPADPCHALADESFVFNYADVEALAAVFKDNKYDYIVPGCTDVSYVSSCHVANRFSLPGFNGLESLDLFQDKAAYRRNCYELGIAAPVFTQDPLEAEQLHFPLLVKPVDSFSGRGIVKINAPSELAEFKKQGFSSQYIYEEFVEGNLYSHSAFIKNQRIVADFFVNEYCTVYPYQVNSSHVATSLSEKLKQNLRANMEHFAKSNHLCDGLLHTQLIIKDNKFWLIEAARRCPGDLYSLLIKYSTGINYAEWYFAGFCDQDIRPQKAAYAKPVSRHTVSVKKDCVFMGVRMDYPCRQIAYVTLKNAGEPLKAAPYERAGIYFIEHESARQMAAMTEKLVDHVIIQSKDAA